MLVKDIQLRKVFSSFTRKAALCCGHNVCQKLAFDAMRSTEQEMNERDSPRITVPDLARNPRDLPRPELVELNDTCMVSGLPFEAYRVLIVDGLHGEPHFIYNIVSGRYTAEHVHADTVYVLSTSFHHMRAAS